MMDRNLNSEKPTTTSSNFEKGSIQNCGSAQKSGQKNKLELKRIKMKMRKKLEMKTKVIQPNKDAMIVFLIKAPQWWCFYFCI